MPKRLRRSGLSGTSSFSVAYLAASSRNGSRESSRQFQKESPKRRRSEINRLAFSDCYGVLSAKIVSAAWPQPLISCKRSDVTSRCSIHTYVAGHRVRRRNSNRDDEESYDESLEYRHRRSSSASRIGRCLCLERISGASHKAIWLEYFRSHADLYNQHLCVGHRGFFRRPLAQSRGTKSRCARRWISVWRRSFSGEFFRPQTVVAISALCCDRWNCTGLHLHFAIHVPC